MKRKIIQLISVIVITAFTWQGIAFADGSNLRPLARAEKFRDTMGYNSSPKGLPGVWFDNEEVYIQNGHMICYFDDGRAFLKNEFPEVANLITDPLELHKFLQGLYANRTEDMARFDYARSHDVFERPGDTPLAYARRKGLLKNMFGCQWLSNTQSFRRHIATNGRRHISLKVPGEKKHGMQLVDEGNYVVSGTVWNAYRRSAHIAKPICEIVLPPGAYKNYNWEPDVEYDSENPYRVVIYRYVDGIRLNTLTPSHIKYFAEQLHCSEERVIGIILRQVFEIAEKIHDLGFAMMQLYLPLDDADRIDQSRMQDASLLSDLHAGNFVVSLEGNEIAVYHVSDFESTNTVEPEAVQSFLTDPSFRLDQLHVFLGGFTEDRQFIESKDIQIGDLIVPANAARGIAQEVIDKHIRNCNVTRARLVIAQLNNVELTDEASLDDHDQITSGTNLRLVLESI